MLLLYFIAAGVVLGVALGGRVSALGEVRIRWWPVALAGLGFQVLLFGPPVAEMVGHAGPPLYVASSLAVMAALLRNLRQPGFALIAVGAALNLAVIAANGGQMPASPEAWALLTGVAQVPVEHFSNSVLISPNTQLAFLGDLFVLPKPIPFANVFSIGDVVIGLGGAMFVVRTMRRTRRPAAAAPPSPVSVIG
jgi:hypothetical protein